MHTRLVGLLTVVMLNGTAGCATGAFHQVSFAGESSPLLSSDSVKRTIYVVPNDKMKDTVLETRIRAKLEAFLLERGYVLSSPDKAELYVLATFGTGNRLVASEAHVFREAEVTVVRDRQGNPVRRVFTPDRMQSLRVPTFENSIWLQVLSSDARYFRETGMVRNLWRGEAAMKGKPEAVDDAAPYLLVPALKFFGRGTQSVVTMDVREKDIPWHDTP